MASADGTRPAAPKAVPMARKLAYRNLFHDQLSLFVTLVGIVFSVVLVAVQCSIYLGSEFRIVAVMDHIKTDLWVLPGGTKSFDLPVLLPGREKYAVLSTPGVQSAEDLIVSFVSWRRLGQGSSSDKTGCATETGTCGTRAAMLVGFDIATNKTLPWDIVEGSLADLSTPNAVAVDSSYFKELAVERIGDRAEINGMQVTVRVVTEKIRSFTTLPFVFANLPLARTLVDASEVQATYTLVQVAPGADIEQVRKSLQARLPDTEVLTHDEFRKRSLDYWLFETGAGSGLIAGAVLGHHRRHRRGGADALCQHQGAHQRVRHLARARRIVRLHPQGHLVAGGAQRHHGLLPGHGAGSGGHLGFSATSCRSS